MTDKELFKEIMTDFGKELGRDFAVDANEWMIPLFGGKVNVFFNYAEESNLVIVMIPVISLVGKPFSAAARSWLLLEMNAFFKESEGCTLAIDPDTGMLTAIDRRAVRYFPTAGALGNYVRQMAEFARSLCVEVRRLEDKIEIADELADTDLTSED